jgi:transposase InsO family protein
MPWKDVSTVSLRREFLQFAAAPDRNLAELCRRYGISRKTAYKWLARAQVSPPTDPVACTDRSRRPHTSPARTPAAVERQVLALRQQHPAWGGRKLSAVLRAQGETAVPAPSTITDILRRHGQLLPEQPQPHAWQRFTAPAPNALWQMDFKGHVPAGSGRCHPLTVLDDHSRFNLCLAACANEQATTVQTHLTATFGRYGLPDRMLMDNGSPWGHDGTHPWTGLTVWLLRLGVGVSHGRPYHPQTQGKEERFHRTLRVEVLSTRPRWPDVASYQTAFDAWRPLYNDRRPHDSLGLRPPAALYQPSPRPFPVVLPPIEYGPGDLIRKVQDKGQIFVHGHTYRIGTAFRGLPVALRPPTLAIPDHFDVYFCHQRVATIDLTRDAG